MCSQDSPGLGFRGKDDDDDDIYIYIYIYIGVQACFAGFSVGYLGFTVLGQD
jgi:hypothetical protein